MVAARRLWLVGILLLLGACNRETPFEQGFEPAFRRTDAPSALALAVIAYNRIDLRWQDNSPNETGFQVHRATGAGAPFGLVATLSAGSTSYADFGLTASSEYCYEVRAFRTTGRNTTFSDFSNIACATTLALPVPAAPSGTNAVPLFSWAIQVGWNDNSNNESGFRVEFSLDNGSTWGSVPWSPGVNATGLNHSGRTPDQTVCYRVFAFNSFGNSAPSNIDCTAPPLAPDQLVGVGVAGPAIDLNWSDNSGVEDGYQVRRAGPGEQSVVVADLPANTESYHDAAVAPNIRFTYSVAAKKDGGFSDFVSVSALTASEPPPAPTAATAVPQNSFAIAVWWTAATDNVDGFDVERSANDGASWESAGSSPWHQTSFYDAGLASEQRWCYRVFASNGAGRSAASPMACTTPPAAPTNLLASSAEGVAIDLVWTDNSNVEEGYQVWKLFDDCGYYYYCYPYWAPVADLPANATTYRDVGLIEGVFYYYFVFAVKNGGYSSGSDVAGAYPGPAIP